MSKRTSKGRAALLSLTCLAAALFCALPARAEVVVPGLQACKAPKLAGAGGDDTASALCLGGKPAYVLRYSAKKNEIALTSGASNVVLHKLQKGREPHKVDAARLIGFLPPELQVYAPHGKLLYTSTMRSTAGGGGGQCGAGVELFLNVLDVGVRVPQLVSTNLIGSCLESIELADTNASPTRPGGLAVENGRLLLKFLNYKDKEGSPAALLSSDLKTLQLP